MRCLLGTTVADWTDESWFCVCVVDSTQSIDWLADRVLWSPEWGGHIIIGRVGLSSVGLHHASSSVIHRVVVGYSALHATNPNHPPPPRSHRQDNKATAHHVERRGRHGQPAGGGGGRGGDGGGDAAAAQQGDKGGCVGMCGEAGAVDWLIDWWIGGSLGRSVGFLGSCVCVCWWDGSIARLFPCTPYFHLHHTSTLPVAGRADARDAQEGA